MSNDYQLASTLEFPFFGGIVTSLYVDQNGKLNVAAPQPPSSGLFSASMARTFASDNADYPFSNWSEHYKAFTESLESTDYSGIYPKYGAMNDESNTVDVDIVNSFLENGLDAQEGLDGLIEAVINGPRYAKDVQNNIKKMASSLMSHGAVPNMAKVFSLKYEAIWDNFEDEMCHAISRAILLKVFGELGIHYDIKGDAMQWEEISSSTDYHVAVNMAIKYELSEL